MVGIMDYKIFETKKIAKYEYNNVHDEVKEFINREKINVKFLTEIETVLGNVITVWYAKDA